MKGQTASAKSIRIVPVAVMKTHTIQIPSVGSYSIQTWRCPMNRTHLLVAIAAFVIMGIGVGLLLPNLQGVQLTGSIAPISPADPWTMTKMRTPAPTHVPPVIRISGTYSPLVNGDSAGLDKWHWELHGMMTSDATCLPAGIQLQRADWRFNGARYDNWNQVSYSRFMVDPR